MTNYGAIMHHEELRTSKVRYLIKENKSPVFYFLFCIWVLFVVLQVSVFNVCSSMEWLGWIGFDDGADSLLLCLWRMWITALNDGGANAFGEREDGVKEKLYEMGLLWKKAGICEKELSYISKLWCCSVCCVQIVNNWGWMPLCGSSVLWLETCFLLCHELQ